MCRGRMNTAYYVLKGWLWQDAKRGEKIESMDILGFLPGTNFLQKLQYTYYSVTRSHRAG